MTSGFLRAKAALRWAASGAAFFIVLALVFLPILFLLAATPLHDGDDVPGPLLSSLTLLASLVVASLAGWLVHRLLRAWAIR